MVTRGSLEGKRPCLNELHKEYCLKIKLIALDWYWVTLISWCQQKRDIHSSPVMHKVEGKTHKVLEKLTVAFWKPAIFVFLACIYLPQVEEQQGGYKEDRQDRDERSPPAPWRGATVRHLPHPRHLQRRHHRFRRYHCPRYGHHYCHLHQQQA